MIEVPSTIVCETPDDMYALGLEVGRMLHAGDLLVLTGPLGAGKTTLTRGIGEGLGVRGPITSPTFVLARTHPSISGGAPLVHVDAYRLRDARELDDLDIDFERSVVVVEWGRGMLAGIAASWLDIEIERPTGAAPAPAAGAESDTPQTVAGSGAESDKSWDLTDSDDGDDGAGNAGGPADDAADDVDEPRIVRIARVAE
ncbi:tRNA (adenosine(37)-N6)-threonylcarbamoyltransferase complex ATPase subunit type 1 TsaE [Microbacterium chengjingii]|uniref:tRNA threonylcarbamoyladenosine biosynthesis protein TsaE n=1 Tax=Paramicrobacterium chengjingii TaxID=2769067 RepID=A0ABX6YK97_9MICO|nr:tRNA (adenosine(37)-N6)-threonylcarbamoyltransferase complex ATPase subunit type 1 TsaE [Microbacterium chengjingii]